MSRRLFSKKPSEQRPVFGGKARGGTAFEGSESGPAHVKTEERASKTKKRTGQNVQPR